MRCDLLRRQLDVVRLGAGRRQVRDVDGRPADGLGRKGERIEGGDDGRRAAVRRPSTRSPRRVRRERMRERFSLLGETITILVILCAMDWVEDGARRTFSGPATGRGPPAPPSSSTSPRSPAAAAPRRSTRRSTRAAARSASRASTGWSTGSTSRGSCSGSTSATASSATSRRARGDHHHHLVCGDCGKVEPFEDPRLERAIEAVEERSGYSVVGHEVLLRGSCADCRA